MPTVRDAVAQARKSTPTWVRHLEANGSFLSEIAVADEALYVGGGVATVPATTGLLATDAFVARYDAEGSLHWTELRLTR
jgi:hypothetical protein